MRWRLGVASITLVLGSCGAHLPPKAPSFDPIELRELWVEPRNLRARDLFHGAGGVVHAPDPKTRFQLLTTDDTGFSPGYRVRDAAGVEWNVKLGIEAQSEIVLSRVLWGIGYHQPPTYLLRSWRMAQAGEQPIARFRRESPEEKVVADWSWSDNPFRTTQPLRGLIVVNVLFNNWDLKSSNNKIYEIADRMGERRRTYVVRDLGASLGKTTFPRILGWTPFRKLPQGSRNNIDHFEEQGFIRRVNGTHVSFDYRGASGRLVETLTVDDVVWACRLLSRITDRQWRDAFRAAAYSDDERSRLVAKVKSKIREGLALEGASVAAKREPRSTLADPSAFNR